MAAAGATPGSCGVELAAFTATRLEHAQLRQHQQSVKHQSADVIHRRAHLSDSLSNPSQALKRLVAAVDALCGLENLQVSGDVGSEIVDQSGATDPGAIRLQVKENRKLSPAEVAELVAAYEAGAPQRELTRRFGLHEQTVRAHLRRQGVALRPLRALTEPQEVEAVRLYVEETWTLAELAAQFGVGQTAVRNVLVRRGVKRRAKTRRIRH